MLVLIRHAKSSWESPGDFERSLNERGESDILIMAEHLPDHVPPPDCVLTSSARRAVTTSEGLLREMAHTSLVPEPLDELYGATEEGILHAIQNRGRGAVLYVCGHNPGISHFISQSKTDPSAILADGRREQHLPTLGIAVFDHDETWENLNWDNLHLKMILTPRQYKTDGS